MRRGGGRCCPVDIGHRREPLETMAVEFVQTAYRPGPKSKRRHSAGARFAGMRVSPLSPPSAAATTDEDGVSVLRRTSKEEETEVVFLSSLDNSGGSSRTMASATTKRTRGSHKGEKRPRNRAALAGTSSPSEEEDPILAIKRRWRPVATGKGVEIRTIKTAKKQLEVLKGEIAVESDIMKGAYVPHEYRKNSADRELQLEEEVRLLPSRDIVTELTKAAQTIDQ